MITPRERLAVSIIFSAVLYAGVFIVLGRVSLGGNPFEDQIGPVYVELDPGPELEALLKKETPRPPVPDETIAQEKPAPVQPRPVQPKPEALQQQAL
ncbi:MAG: hypothetical protein E4H36_15425, partial [Spirochaetales bacterium]